MTTFINQLKEIQSKNKKWRMSRHMKYQLKQRFQSFNWIFGRSFQRNLCDYCGLAMSAQPIQRFCVTLVQLICACLYECNWKNTYNRKAAQHKTTTIALLRQLQAERKKPACGIVDMTLRMYTATQSTTVINNRER